MAHMVTNDVLVDSSRRAISLPGPVGIVSSFGLSIVPGGTMLSKRLLLEVEDRPARTCTAPSPIGHVKKVDSE